MSKIIKIKANVSFIHEDGTFIEAGKIATVTDAFLQEQNTLCGLFSLPKHEVLEEAESQEDVVKTAKSKHEVLEEAESQEDVVKTAKSKQKAAQKQEGDNDL